MVVVMYKATYGYKTNESASWLKNSNTVCGIPVRLGDLLYLCPRKTRDRVVVISDRFSSAFF